MTLRCPVCKVDLHAIANRTGVAAVCGTCFGIWLDNVCSRSVVANVLDGAVTDVAEQADARAAQKHAASAEAGAYRTAAARPATNDPPPCAECGAAMAPSYIASANVTLDVCAAHGTWFDPRELHTLSQQLEIDSFEDDAEAAAEAAAFRRQVAPYQRSEYDARRASAAAVVGLLFRR